MARRQYYGAATPTTITGSITTSSSSVAIAAYTGWPTGSFSLVIDPGLSSEEKILATSQTSGTITFTTRGYDGTTASAHNAGAVIYPVPTAIDFDEANAVTTKYSATGDLTYASAANTPATLAIGSTNNQLAVIAGVPAWIASPDVPKSTVTAKGDLIAATASSTVTNLAVGSDGQTLVANSSQTTGLGWSPLGMAGKNRVINGAMNIAQRGTTYALTNAVAYGSVDRWAFYQSGTANGIANQVASGLTGFQYAIKMGRNSGATTTGVVQGVQPFETANSVDLQGQVVTFSFYAKAGANFSAASNNITYAVYTGTGTDQSAASQAAGAWTGILVPILGTQAITTTWTRYSYTGTISSTATQVGVGMYYTPTGTAGADDNLYITGVQLELGSVATTFSRNATTLQGELAACQRYYFRSVAGSIYGGLAAGQCIGTTSAAICLVHPVTMRIVPTSLDYANIGVLASTGSAIALASATINYPGFQSSFVSVGVASGLLAGNATILVGANNTAGYIGLSAEL